MSDGELDFAFEAAAAPALVLGKKKKKKKKKEDDIDESGPVVEKKAKNKKKAEVVDVEAEERDIGGFGALGVNESDGENDEVKEPNVEKSEAKSEAKSVVKRKGKKDKAPPPAEEEDLDAILASLDAPALDEAPTPKKGKKKAKAKTKPAAGGVEEDIDALLAEMDVGFGAKGCSADAAAGDDLDEKMAVVGGAAPSPAAKKKKKKKLAKAAPAPVDDDDLDALLAEVAPAAPAVEAQESRPGGAGDDLDDMMAEVGGAGGPIPSAAKKKKKKAKKAAGASAAVEEKPSAKPKKESAALRKLREQQERAAVAEEEYAAAKAAEEERVREEEKKEADAAARKAATKAARKEAEKARKARLKAEGKLLTKTEAERKRKADAFREQAIAGGLVAAAVEEGGGEGGKVIYGKKRKAKAKGGSVEEKVEETIEEKEESEKEEEAVAVVEEKEEEVPDEWDAEELSANGEDDGEGDAAADESWEKDGEVKGENGADGEASDDGSDSDDSSDASTDSFDSDDFEGMSRTEVASQRRIHNMRKDRAAEAADAKSNRSPDVLRSPVICILGHVDTGKTKILDRIRRTNVQDGEAGGITQQIGATYFPIEAVKKETLKLEEGHECPYNVPSLLIIDTPGHESFTNLRSRGSSLCDIAILVIDITHGLEPQTRESIDLLKLRKTPFVVALNKCDRMFDWEATEGNNPFRDSLGKQKGHVIEEFNRRVKETQVELATVGFNTALYWENDDVRKMVSIIPTSAITGEGMPDLLLLITSLSQKLLQERLMFNPILEATVLEVKVIEGLGTTVDIILTGGTIKEGDTVVVVGLDGPIQATIRALLTPHPMKEMRVRGQYLHHKQIRAAQGIKISADGLEKAVAGTQLLVARNPGDEDEMAYLRDEVMKDFATILQNVDKSGEGVYVQASTLGSLEALLEFLRTSEIPVSGINIGPVFKKDVMRSSAMLERNKEYATILAFDVPVEKEAREMAEDVGVTIFTADIIYNLFDMFTDHMAECKKARQAEAAGSVVFPCVLKILQQHIFNKKDPIVLGVDVSKGILRVGCPLVVRSADAWLDIGRVVSIEVNGKTETQARAGSSVCVKIESSKTSHITYGRHFTWTDDLVSKMSREAIEILKTDFRDDLGKLDWQLVILMKKWFAII